MSFFLTISPSSLSLLPLPLLSVRLKTSPCAEKVPWKVHSFTKRVTCFFSFSHHAVCLFPGSSSPNETSSSSILILLTLGCSTEQAEYTHLGKERVGALMSTHPLNLPWLEELKYVCCKCWKSYRNIHRKGFAFVFYSAKSDFYWVVKLYRNLHCVTWSYFYCGLFKKITIRIRFQLLLF